MNIPEQDSVNVLVESSAPDHSNPGSVHDTSQNLASFGGAYQSSFRANSHATSQP